jgi:hypothetical protein
MIERGKRLHAQNSFYGHRVDFYLIDYNSQGERMIANSVGFTDMPSGGLVEPSFSLDLDVAQEFFEQLWRQGFRSVHDKGGSDRLDAARSEHIADLRKAAKLS